MTAETDAAVLFYAADIMQFTGHARHEYVAHDGQGHIVGMCANAAVTVAVKEVTGEEMSFAQVEQSPLMQSLKRRVGQVVFRWSDNTPTEEVIDTLRLLGKDIANGEVILNG